MSRIYKRPPLIEALCEFRFDPGQPWDWTIPGLLYAELGKEFPKKREQRAYEIALQEGPKEAKHSLRQELARMQFLREDESALMQIGHDILAVNHLRPYPSWPNLRALIGRILNAYRKVASPKGFHRIGLRFINRLEIPEKSPFEIEDYLTAIPAIPRNLPQTFARWLQRTDLPFEEIDGMLTLQTASVVDSEPADSTVFMLDLDCWTVEPGKIELDQAMDWVERAHAKVEEAFEASITDKARSLFQEVKDAERARA